MCEVRARLLAGDLDDPVEEVAAGADSTEIQALMKPNVGQSKTARLPSASAELRQAAEDTDR